MPNNTFDPTKVHSFDFPIHTDPEGDINESNGVPAAREAEDTYVAPPGERTYPVRYLASARVDGASPP